MEDGYWLPSPAVRSTLRIQASELVAGKKSIRLNLNDFPTGGLILGRAGIRQAYLTGRGGFRVRAKWEREALKNGETYDAIVLDVMLPDVNGFELCQRLRDAGNFVPVIMLTAAAATLALILYATTASMAIGFSLYSCASCSSVIS